MWGEIQDYTGRGNTCRRRQQRPKSSGPNSVPTELSRDGRRSVRWSAVKSTASVQFSWSLQLRQLKSSLDIDVMKRLSVSLQLKLGTERVYTALADILRSALCCHSNESRAPIANPPISARLGGTPTIPQVAPGSVQWCENATRDRQTHRRA